MDVIVDSYNRNNKLLTSLDFNNVEPGLDLLQLLFHLLTLMTMEFEDLTLSMKIFL